MKPYIHDECQLQSYLGILVTQVYKYMIVLVPRYSHVILIVWVCMLHFPNRH